MEFLWGIDMGGTKIECAVIKNIDSLEIVHRERVPTESQMGYDHILGQFKKLIDQVSHKVGEKPTTIGVGMPGAIEPMTGLLKNSNTTCLNGRPFQKDLSNHLGIPVFMMNDANCFSVAETIFGAVSELDTKPETVFGVIMGTGVGGGIVVHGKPLNGKHSIAGEWGHNFLDESGGMCYCGRIGCTETVISGPSTERYYAQIAGHKLAVKDIVLNYRNGTDPFAKETMERLFEFFAKGISRVINILDPDIIVMGGGLANIDELYTEGVKRIENYIFNDVVHTQIVKPKLGDSAGVFGAALLNR